MTTPTIPVELRIDLDKHRQLVQDIEIATRMVEQAERTRDELRDRLRKEIGEGNTGFLDGEAIWTFGPTSKLASAKLKKEHPDIFDEFSEWTTSRELDVKRLAKERPDLHQQYLVRSLRPVGTNRVALVHGDDR